MSGAGKINAARLEADARKRSPVPPAMNRAARRAAAGSVSRSYGGRKRSGAQVLQVRKAFARGLLRGERALAATRAQVVDPKTGRTVAEEKKRGRLWTPGKLWTPRSRGDR